MKQAQLHLAASGPVDVADRHEIVEQLKLMKSKDHVPRKSLQISWAYFAGLFDSDGCITVPPYGSPLRLEVQQANPHMLKELRVFLDGQGLQWHLYNKNTIMAFRCMSETVCEQTLERLLNAGLCVKQEQAELALSIASENRWQIREAISQLKGHQCRYLRHDIEGLDLAKQITKLRGRLKRATCKHAKESLEEELEILCQSQRKQKLVCKVTALRSDLRKLVEDGASIMPLDQNCCT